MFRKIVLLCALTLSSCISVSVETETPVAPVFVTSTLPPTKNAAAIIADTPTLAVTLTPVINVAVPANCVNSAALLEDVTYPDGTIVPPSQKFTKTWRFLNNGTCPWINYTVLFAAGDRMDAPLSVPIPLTEAKTKVDISVELTAPATNGEYTAYFTLNAADSKDVPIGTEMSFWVKIVVGAAPAVPTQGASPTQSGSVPASDCKYSVNDGYIAQLANAINAERAKAGLPVLSVNAELTTAAQGHAADMACNNMLSHSGSDGSTIHARVVAAGYIPTYSEEIIYAGGSAQNAMTWWMNDKIHRDAILNPKVTEMGAGHAYYSNSLYGDYFTVDFGNR
jgi:uncharacterized protein YkwD